METEPISTLRRWSLLSIALFATLFSNVFINGVAFLIPTLHRDFGLDLALAGLISAMPKFGMVPTLIPWGYVVDRAGERFVLWLGSALTAAAALAAAISIGKGSHSLVLTGGLLFLGGMAAASSNSASGRLVVGWFPAEQRGLAMGIRQTAQPLGVGLGALVMPQLAEHHGMGAALMFPAAVCALAAVVCAVAVIDPPRPPRAEAPPEDLANPYRGSQILGALGRIAAGRWSDKMGARLRPIRIIAAAAAASMLLLAFTDLIDSAWSIAVLIAASVVTVSDNGLAFTAIAEIAGPFWSGRALGAQNTSQLLMTGLTPPVFGALIGAAGYPVAFAVCALFPVLAIPLVPADRDSANLMATNRGSPGQPV